MKVTYFAHDLHDPAIARRARMLQEGGAELTLVGFARGDREPGEVAGQHPVLLGRTQDGRLARRAAAIAGAAARLPAWADALAGSDLVMARTLEMLLLASLARRLRAPRAALAYECLDIHRLMLAPGAAGHAMRGLERRLLRRCTGLVVSSPAFLTRHFARYPALPPSILLENKVLASELEDARSAAERPQLPAEPPWRIGWFGVIRCRRSLALLAELVRRLPGRVEVVIRGRPARDAVPEFDQVVADTPGLSFDGAYDRGTELARLYGGVHFTWAIDFYEAGANSDWLLPNRLYEGSLHGAVPLALAGVETGRWLERHRCGVRLTDPAAELAALFASLEPAAYAGLRAAVTALPRAALVEPPDAGATLLAALLAPPHAAASPRPASARAPLRAARRAEELHP